MRRMSSMTWADFKRLAEERGVRDEDLISYIDVFDQDFSIARQDGEVQIA